MTCVDSAADLPSFGLMRTHVERPGGAIERDLVVIEEPLEIRVDGQALLTVMRTPGHDRELATGLLYSEGIVRQADELETVETFNRAGYENVVGVLLRGEASERAEALRRDVTATAGCGLCGRPTFEDLLQGLEPVEPFSAPRQIIETLPERMRQAQELFNQTGGLHAAALFDLDTEPAELLGIYEDIGRHNAVDKLIGRAFLDGHLPLSRRVLMVSARAGFEILHKAARAGIPVTAAAGAASSYAVRLAQRLGIELYSFVGEGRGNRHVHGNR